VRDVFSLSGRKNTCIRADLGADILAAFFRGHELNCG
jgi:hypothetical protein